MKKLSLSLMILLSSLSFGDKKIKISSLKDLSFQRVAVAEANKDKIRATGYIDIRLEEPLKNGEDYETRLLVINHRKNIKLTNGHQNLKVEDINIAVFKGEGKIVDDPSINTRGTQVIFDGYPIKLEVSGIVDRDKVDSQAEDIEGEYTGSLNLSIKQYKER